MLLILAGSVPAHAQTDSTQVDAFSVDVTPQYPSSYQTITLTPSSSQFDISGATLRRYGKWSVIL